MTLFVSDVDQTSSNEAYLALSIACTDIYFNFQNKMLNFKVKKCGDH